MPADRRHAHRKTFVNGRAGARKLLSAAAWLLPLICCAFLATVFYRAAVFNESFRYYPYAWHAHWIHAPFGGARTACFRKTFTLTQRVRTAYIAVAADNFYAIQVNDVEPNGFFRPSQSRTLASDSTTYTGLAYSRNSMSVASIYNIAPYLRQGHNVISVTVQTDDAQPRLIVQGAILGDEPMEIVSDTTWRCAPHGETQHGIGWESPRFLDTGWTHSMAGGEPAPATVDGDISVFEEPMHGRGITASVSRTDIPVHFRKTIDCPSPLRDGWLRVGIDVPYDLFLNGRLIGSTATLARYSRSALSTRAAVDVLTRLQNSNLTYQYASVMPSSSVDVYELRHVLRRGLNQIEITVHSREMPQLQALPYLYLDGKFTFAHDTAKRVQTDQNWQARSLGSQWCPVQVASDNTSAYQRQAKMRIRGRIDSADTGLARIALNTVLLFSGILALSMLTAWLARGARDASMYRIVQRAGLLGLGPMIILLGGCLVQWIFFSSPQDQWLESPLFATILLLLAAAAWISMAGAELITSRIELRTAECDAVEVDCTADIHDAMKTRLRSVSVWLVRWCVPICLGTILVTAAALYTHALGHDDYLPDEYVSLLAAKGIMRHGVPLFENTGVIYTRSSLYHYLLALWMWVAGSQTNAYATRLLAGCWQLALILLVYLFGREVKGRSMGLIAAAMVAFSPYVAFYAREARFYTQFAFFVTLTLYLLLRSVRRPDRPGYRIAVVLAYCGAYLSHQFALATLPAIAAVVLFAGQGRLWLQRRMIPWIALAFIVMVLDYVAYLKYCQTPLNFVDTDAALPLAIHLDILELLPSMLLLNTERAQMVVGLCFMSGLVLTVAQLFRKGYRNALIPYSVEETTREPARVGPNSWRWASYLYLVTCITLGVTTLIASRPSNRYIIHVVPLVALAAAGTVEHVRHWLRNRASSSLFPASSQLLHGIFVAVFLLVSVSSFRPVRTWNATERNNNRGTGAAARFIASNIRSSDKVIFFSPEVAMVELGRCDYLWRPRRGSIFKYMSSDGRLRERNSGGIVLDNVDKLRRVVENNQRVWLVIHPGSIGSPGATPSGEMAQFLADNFQVVYEPFSMQVLLWDRQRNHYINKVHTRGYDQFNF